MEILLFLGYVYIAIGVIYGIFILFNGADAWYMLPVNVLFGPIMIVYLIIATILDKDLT